MPCSPAAGGFASLWRCPDNGAGARGADRPVKAAKKALQKADCKLGKLTGKKSKSAKVTKQSPKPGKVLPPGSKVNVKLD